MRLLLLLCIVSNSIQFIFNKKNNFKRTVCKYDKLSKIEEIKTYMNQENGYGVLSTIANYKKIKDYPQTSLVGYSVDNKGYPIFCLSNLAIHTRNLLLNSKVSFFITEPGFKNEDDSRVTFTGNINKVNCNELKERYMKAHKGSFWINFNDFNLYSLNNLKDISFNGGFSKADKIPIKEYLNADVDIISLYYYKNYKSIKHKYYKIFEKYIKIFVKNVDGFDLKKIDKFGVDFRIYKGFNTYIYRVPFNYKIDNITNFDEIIKDAFYIF